MLRLRASDGLGQARSWTFPKMLLPLMIASSSLLPLLVHARWLSDTDRGAVREVEASFPIAATPREFGYPPLGSAPDPTPDGTLADVPVSSPGSLNFSPEISFDDEVSANLYQPVTAEPPTPNNEDYGAQGPAVAPMPPASIPPSPPSSTGTCPPSASQCDFYFKDHMGEIPVVTLADANGDAVLLSSLECDVKGSKIDVVAANSNMADYLPCTSSGAERTKLAPDNQFYITQNNLLARTFQKDMKHVYEDCFVRLNLTSVQLSIYSLLTNLNPGQSNPYFPEERRCVIFKTSP